MNAFSGGFNPPYVDRLQTAPGFSCGISSTQWRGSIPGNVRTPDRSDEPAFGRYLANTVCTECHGSDLRGSPDGTMPGLAMVLAYSREDFETLMRTGEPLGGRELGLMADVSRARFARFTDDEVTALHSYLNAPETWSN